MLRQKPETCPTIKDLDFLTGIWEIEENHTNGWWEKGIRTGRYILNDTYLELETSVESSEGKKRSYRFLTLDKYNSVLEIKGIISPGDYSIRNGKISFSDKDNYTWVGRNVSSDNNRIIDYIETGKRK